MGMDDLDEFGESVEGSDTDSAVQVLVEVGE
jgi:hypothetical protein